MMRTYPLSWPKDWPKTRAEQRHPSRGTLLPNALQLLERALRAARVERPKITTNVELDPSGEPTTSNSRAGLSPGASVMFTMHGIQVGLACDRFQATAENVRELVAAVEGVRGIERLGRAIGVKVLTALRLAGLELPAARNVPHWSETEREQLNG